MFGGDLLRFSVDLRSTCYSMGFGRGLGIGVVMDSNWVDPGCKRPKATVCRGFCLRKWQLWFSVDTLCLGTWTLWAYK